MNCKSCFLPVDTKSRTTCSECKATLHAGCVINLDGVSLCDVCFTVTTEKPKSKFGEFTLPDSIRRTHIETYRKCPYKFYLEVIKGNEQPPNEYTQIGSDLHELFEEAVKSPLHANPQTMTQEFRERYWNQYRDELFYYKSRSDMWKRAEDSIDTFFTVLPRIRNVFAVEEKIFFNIGENLPHASIIMDCITDADGELEIHDWKTGNILVGKNLSSDLQAPLYIHAVKTHFKREVRSFTFHYLSENKTRTFVRSETDPNTYICTVNKRQYIINTTDAIRQVQTIFSHIKKGNFNIPQDTKKMYFTCKMCHLREMNLCAGADEQSWYQIQ